jgi:hypothetical protein
MFRTIEHSFILSIANVPSGVNHFRVMKQGLYFSMLRRKASDICNLTAQTSSVILIMKQYFVRRN